LENFEKLWNMEPANELLNEREPNEAYLVKNKDNSVLFIYFPYQGEVSLDTKKLNLAGTVMIEWLDITYARFHLYQQLDIKDMMTVKAPLKKGCIAIIKNS